MRWIALIAIVAGCQLWGCGDDSSPPAEPEPQLADNFGVEETEGDAACEPLDPHVCMFPFPSDRFLERPSDGPPRVVLSAAALPLAADDLAIDPVHMNGVDGFSIATPLLFSLPGAQPPTPDGFNHLADSLEADSPTVVIDTETGARIPHWLEVDHFSRGGEVEVLTIRFAAALDFSRRYVVAVRSLLDAAGTPVLASPSFALVRDGDPSPVRGLHARRQSLEADVFPVLEAAGVDRAELQLAWDFTTGGNSDTDELLGMRDDLLAALPADGPAYEITKVTADPHPAIAYMVELTAQIPSFLLPAEEQLHRLRRDDDGRPKLEGLEEIDVEIQIPHAAYEAPAAIMQYGHGLLGTRAEAHGGWLRNAAQRQNFVIVAIDMQGMNNFDAGIWAVILFTDLGRFPLLTDKIRQGVLNHVAVMRLAAGAFASDVDPRFNPDGKALIDPTRRYYSGNSQGGTMGNIIMTLHPDDVPRGVLGVPGCAFGFLLQRSIDFTPFTGPILLRFPESWHMPALLALVQHGFDPIEPLNIITALSPAKSVLLHVAKEDAQVENQLSFVLARSFGAAAMTPAVRPIYGLQAQTYPYRGSAVVEYDFGVPDNPDPVAPPSGEDTHDFLRKHTPGQDQLWHFLETGEVRSYCDDVCDPD